MSAVERGQRWAEARDGQSHAGSRCLFGIDSDSGAASELCSRVTIGPPHALELGSTASTQGPRPGCQVLMSCQHKTRRGRILAALGCWCSWRVWVHCACVHGDIPTHDMTSGRMPNGVGCQTATAICSPWRQGQRIDAAGQLPARAASPVASAGARACWGAGEWAGAVETC
jgi:hypothetical protein